MATAIVDPELEQLVGLDFDAAIDEVTGHLNAQHARLVDLTIALLADDSLWAGTGSTPPSCSSPGAQQRARQIVTVARRADELPASIAAFRRGELAIDQMAAVAHRAPWWTDSEVCALAKMLTVTQLRRTLERYPFPDIPAPGDENPSAVGAGDGDGEAADATADDTADDDASNDNAANDESAEDHAAPDDSADGDDSTPDGDPDTEPGAEGSPDGSMTTGWAWWGVGDDGKFRLTLELDPLSGMTIDAAIREARDRLIQAGHRDVTDADAVVEMAQRSLDNIESPQRRERFRINVHLRTNGTCTDDHGTTLPDAIRRYITCDGLMSPVFIHGAIPISVGRTQRMIPMRTRRVVLLRDQGCRVPGCTITHHIEVHHIIHWEDDGPTDTWNLIALCPRHHRMHHRGELGVTGNADDPAGITFTNRHGRVLNTTGARPQPPGAPPPSPTGVYNHPLGERLDARWLYFNPPPEHRVTAWANHPHNPLRAS